MYVITTRDPHEIARLDETHAEALAPELAATNVFTSKVKALAAAKVKSVETGVDHYVCKLTAVAYYEGRRTP